MNLQDEQLHLAELDGLNLDFYHVSENMHLARRVEFGENSVTREIWVDELIHAFKHDGRDSAWEQLVQWRVKLDRSLAKRQAADRPLNYLSQRREIIRNPSLPRQRLSNRQQSDRLPVQADSESTEKTQPAVGPPQRCCRHRAGLPGTERPMAIVLEPPRRHCRLAPPECLGTLTRIAELSDFIKTCPNQRLLGTGCG